MKKKTKNVIPLYEARKKQIYITILTVTVVLAVLIIFAIYNNINQDKRVVATVNDQPIMQIEFKAQMSQERVKVISYFTNTYSASVTDDFWTKKFDNEIPIEYLRKAALEKCVNIKVQQIQAKQAGIIEDISYVTFMDDLKKENIRRKEAVEKKQVIYGPIQYGEPEYFSYLFSNMVTKLKENLASNELKASEEECKAYYNKQKENLFKKPDYIKTDKLYFKFNDEKGRTIAKTAAEEAKIEAEKLKSIEKATEIIVTKGQFEQQVFNEETNRQDGKYTPELFSAVKGLKRGDISEVVQVNGYYAVLQCVEWKDNGYSQIDEVKEEIIVALTSEKYDEFVSKLVKEARVEIVDSVYKKLRVN